MAVLKASSSSAKYCGLNCTMYDTAPAKQTIRSRSSYPLEVVARYSRDVAPETPIFPSPEHRLAFPRSHDVPGIR